MTTDILAGRFQFLADQHDGRDDETTEADAIRQQLAELEQQEDRLIDLAQAGSVP